jgi:hypothetical protein
MVRPYLPGCGVIGAGIPDLFAARRSWTVARFSLGFAADRIHLFYYSLLLTSASAFLH